MTEHAGENRGKLCISYILSSKRGITPSKIDGKWQHLHLICSTLKQSLSKISAHYVKACRKVRKTTHYLYPKFHKEAKLLRILTQSDNTRTCSIVQLNKVMCKIPPQYVRACRRKLRRSVWFLYFKFKKKYDSFKNWRKVTTLKLDL